jgi:hypothetical protein
MKEVIPPMAYEENDVRYDLEVIDWLLTSGNITEDDARFMRHYLESLGSR